MNQGRIWCVVHPTVGLPLFLGSVAITSLVVHASVMTHTTWMGNYWQGKAARVAENGGTNVASADSKTLPGYSMTVTPVPPTSGSAQASFVVTLSPTATAVSPDQAQLVDPSKQTTSAVALK